MQAFGLLYFGSVLVFYFVAARLLRARAGSVADATAVALDLVTLYAGAMFAGARLVSWVEGAAQDRVAGAGLRGGAGVFMILLVARLAASRVDRVVMAEVASVALPVGLAVAKVGCAFAGCCFGAPTALPWAVEHRWGAYVASVHPTQVYDVLVFVAATAIAYVVARRRPGTGYALLASTLVIAAGRAATDFFRGDAVPVGGTPFTATQWIAGAGGLAAAAVLVLDPVRQRWRDLHAQTPVDAESSAAPPSVFWVLLATLGGVAAVLLSAVGIMRLVVGPHVATAWPGPRVLWRWLALALSMALSSLTLALTPATFPSLAPILVTASVLGATLVVLLRRAARAVDDAPPAEDEAAETANPAASEAERPMRRRRRPRPG